MNTERDKFLTEAIGECWHEWEEYSISGGVDIGYHCVKCEGEVWGKRNYQLDFSSWESFGKLWEHCTAQPWWLDFYNEVSFEGSFPLIYIYPDIFADAIYAYLRDNPK